MSICWGFFLCYIRCHDLLHGCIIFVCKYEQSARMIFGVCYRDIAPMLHTWPFNVGWVRHKCSMHWFFLLETATHLYTLLQNMRICYIQFFLLHVNTSIIAKLVATCRNISRFPIVMLKTYVAFQKMLHTQKKCYFFAVVTWSFAIMTRIFARTIFCYIDQTHGIHSLK
jgi:hypothetical protein